MKKFIYCFNEQLKDDLLSKNFKLIQTFNSSNAKIWIFENSVDINKYSQFSKNEGISYSNCLCF